MQDPPMKSHGYAPTCTFASPASAIGALVLPSLIVTEQLPVVEPGITGTSTCGPVGIPELFSGYGCPSETLPVQTPALGIYVGVLALVSPGSYAMMPTWALVAGANGPVGLGATLIHPSLAAV